MGILLECSVRATLIAGAVAAVIGALRIASASARHRAWCTVLAGMLLLPAMSIWGPKMTIRVLWPIPESPLAAPLIPETWNPAAAANFGASPPVGSNDQTPAMEPLSPRPSWGSILFGLYLSGVGLQLMRLFLGTWQAASLLRRVSPEQGFVSTPECACPVTLGWWRPVAVLPTCWREWPEDELHAVLAHEREHAARRDPLIQWLAALNRCVFWFHPLAWWLQRELATLAEEVCDAAAVAAGHDPRDYTEYLLHQARAMNGAAGRLFHRLPQGAAMSRGSLAQRISRLLDAPTPPGLSFAKRLCSTMLCTSAAGAFTACQLDRVEKPAPGQPTMNELMHRRVEERRPQEEKRKAILARARTMTDDDVRSSSAALKKNPDDEYTYWILVRYYEHKSNVKDLDDLRLWYIEHHPGGKVWPGNINPHLDPAGYERGKRLWLAHLKHPGVTAEMYQRAGDFLDGGDKPMAEAVLKAARKEYPNDERWASALGRHYAQALLGSAEPVTEFNVFRVRSEEEARSPYSQTVRAALAESTDVNVLAHTAQYLLTWSGQFNRGRIATTMDALQLARTYIDRALSIEPHSGLAQAMKDRLEDFEHTRKAQQLAHMSPDELANMNDSDRILLLLFRMRQDSYSQNPDAAAAKARKLLELAAGHHNDPLYGDAVFEANMILGKVALRRGDRKTAVRALMAAADTPGSARIRRGEIEMNLPRALVDRGERTAVAQFLNRMAPKTARSKQFQDWAAEISKGINPDLMPTFSAPGCSHDPC